MSFSSIGFQRSRPALVSPLRNPPSVRVECCIEPVFGSTMGDAGAAGVPAAEDARRAGALRAAGLAAPFAAPDFVLAVARDVDLRAAVVRDFGAAFFAVPAVLDVALRVVDDFAALVRADVADLERLDAAGVFRAVPLLVALLLVVLLLADGLLRAVVLLVPADLAVVVMTFAAASIAFAASDIALVALVIALVMAVMALADEDALVATDFICVAAVLAWLAALVTRVAAADDDADVLLDADLFAVPVLVPVARDVVDLVDDFAAEVRFAAGFFAVLDLVADVLFVRPAVPRLVVRDAVLVGTDLPPVMISYGEIYSTLRDPLHTYRYSRSDAYRMPDGLGLQERRHAGGSGLGRPVGFGGVVEALEVAGGFVLEVSDVFGWCAGEVDGVDVHVGGQPGGEFGAVSGEDVDHAGGQVGGGQDLGEGDGGQRRRFGRDGHGGVAGDDDGCEDGDQAEEG
jgi:hypothetical protein